jgi:hypothetical protein
MVRPGPGSKIRQALIATDLRKWQGTSAISVHLLGLSRLEQARVMALSESALSRNDERLFEVNQSIPFVRLDIYGKIRWLRFQSENSFFRFDVDAHGVP